MKPDKPKATTPSAKKPDNKVFDVRRPGKAAASPSSRPVILGHKPEAQQAQTSVSGIGDAQPLLAKRKIQIFPAGGGATETVEPAVDEQPKEAAPTPTLAQPEHKMMPSREETEAIASAALDGVTGVPELPSTEKAPEGPKSATSPVGRTITPVTESSEPPAEPKAEEEKPAEEPAPVESAPEAKEEPAPEAPAQPEPEPKAEEAEKPETEGPPTVASELPKDTTSVPDESAKKKEGDGTEQKEEEEEKPEPHIEPLFDDSGAIVVSHHDRHRSHQGAMVFLLLLLVIVLAAVVLDIVLDLGLINLPINIPHTNLL